MYVHYKNYSLGKTTHERFSKRAVQIPADRLRDSDLHVNNMVGDSNTGDIENEATAELIKKVNGGSKKKGCCNNWKRMMYQKEMPTQMEMYERRV